MTLLRWDKPSRAIPVAEWKAISADDAPPGVYTPNMRPADAQSWKAKLTGTKSGRPQVEIRKSTAGMTQMLIIVGLDGYDYKYYTREPKPDKPTWAHVSTRGFNVHLSLNGPAQMTFYDVNNLHIAVHEAKEFLERWEDIRNGND